MRRDRQKQSLSFTNVCLEKVISNRQKLAVFVCLFVCSTFILQSLITVKVEAASRTISGRVFQDFDGDGVFDTTQTLTNTGGGTIGVAVDVGVQGVTVTAYDTNGTAQPAATTAANGTYTITTATASVGPYRIEFTNLPAGYYPSARSTDSVNGGTATNSGTTVQFVADANTTNVNLAVNRPTDYSENNPLLATSVYAFGHRTDSNTNVLPSFLYSVGSNSTTSDVGYSNGTQNTEAIKPQIGSVFGLAFRNSTDTLYAATFMKRHTGIGPGGVGAIYRIPAVSNLIQSTPTVFTVIPNAGTDTHPTVAGGGVIWEQDFSTFGAVGRLGLGGLEISDDGNSLFTINLNTRELFEIPIATALPVSRGVVPNPTCTNGIGRPFAVKYFNGLVYVGGVCTAENSGTAANLRAYVYTFNPATGTFSASPVFNVALNYNRGCVDDSQTDPTCHGGEENAEWRPWVSTLNFDTVDADNDTQVAYPQPMLTDIEFVGNDMILGFRDRIGDQGGNGSRNPGNAADTTSYVTNTAGDILRANPNGSGGWNLENNSQSNPTGTFGPTTGQNNNQGPGNGEFYFGEAHTYHDEVSNGGLTYIPGYPDVLMSAMDPANFGSAVWDGGVRWLSNTSGAQTKGFLVYNGNRLDNLFGKANGVGELEPLSRPAPIELGSRVWRDTDNDGAQDPVNGTTEAGIQNVTVRLYRPGFGADGIAGNADDNTALATAVTDVNGEYYFTSGTGDGNTGDNIGILNGNILPNTAYEIRVDNNANFQTGGALFTGGAALNLTVPNATAQSGFDDGSDSDGLYDPNTNCSATSNMCPTISFSTGSIGANDHTLDFGFTTDTTYTPTSVVYSIGNRVWFDTNNNGLRDTGGTPEVGVANVSLSIFDDADNNGTPDSISAPLQTVWTNINGYYRFDGLRTGNYVVRVDPQNFAAGSPLAGYQSSTTTEADPDSAVDNNDNGINPSNLNNPLTSVNGILSGAITVGPGTAEPTGETDLGPGDSGIPDNRADLTLDFGFYCLNLSGTVWRDTNNNGLLGAGERGLNGIRVRIFDSAGTTEIPVGPDGILGTSDDALGGVATNASGDYSFKGIASGSYVVKVTTPNASSSSSAPGYEPAPNPDNNIDNDDNGSNGTGGNAGLLVSLPKTMTPGGPTSVNNAIGQTSNPTLDFGVVMATSAVELVGFNAYQDGNQVLLKWESGYEIDNLGYNIIREANGKQALVNSSMLAGSALKVGTGTALTAGNSYLWSDILSAKEVESGVRYWLEAIDVNGSSELYGPFVPENGIPASESSERAKTLSELGREASDVQTQREFPFVLSQQKDGTVNNKNTKAVSSATKQKTELNVANQSAVKITVRKDGWYRASREQLASAGFNVASDSYRWQLFANGEEKPMRVNADGSIEFYGKALDTRSTDGQVYWLFASNTKGLRVDVRSFDGIDIEIPSTFMQTIERRERIIRFSALINGDADNYFGPIINGSSEVRQSLFVEKLDTEINATASIEVGVQGLTLQGHTVEVKLNGEVLGTINLFGRERPSMMFNLPSSTLLEGKNVISLISRESGSDVNLLDFVRVTYPRKAVAVNNYLTFGTNAGQQTRVTGFTTDRLRVVDITNPSAPIEIAVRTQQIENDFGFSLSPTTSGRKIMAFALGQESMTAEISANIPSNLRNVQNAADLLIITHRHFGKAAELLRDRRVQQGFNTVIVDIEDVYDEFGYGVHSADALREFLTFALTRWQGKPGYVLLLGDASYDPRNYLGGGGAAADIVPTGMIDADYLETASDESLADIDNDGVAEAAIGRLPVRNAEEAIFMVNKLFNYEDAVNRNTAQRGAVMISDSANNFDFAERSAQVSAQLPPEMELEFINRNDGDVNSVRERIRTALNTGPAVVNYLGHGSTTSWTNASLLTGADAMNLQNESRLSLVVMMSCLNGSFGETGFDSIAESLIKSRNGGAVAVWASSGLSSPDKQELLNQFFYQSLFSNQNVMFGNAVREAKLSIEDKTMRRTWIFFGDPTMRLR